MDNNDYQVMIKVCSNPELRHAIFDKNSINASSYGISKKDFATLQAKVATFSSANKDSNIITMLRC